MASYSYNIVINAIYIYIYIYIYNWLKIQTIANMIIFSGQNVKSEHLSIVIIYNISFQGRKLCLCLDEFHRSRQHQTAKAATGWPEITQTLASWTTQNTSYCMEYKCMQLSVPTLDMHTCSYYTAKGMLGKSIPLATHAWHNRVVTFVIAIRKC